MQRKQLSLVASAVVCALMMGFGEFLPLTRNLREAVGRLFGAVAQSAHAANADQQQRILDIVNNARREIYQILGES